MQAPWERSLCRDLARERISAKISSRNNASNTFNLPIRTELIHTEIQMLGETMDKTTNFVLGALVGVGIGILTGYILAPARGTRYDSTYQSRLDKAMEEGRKAAAAREAELRREFEAAKHRPAQQPPAAS